MAKSLEQIMQETDIVTHLRNSKIGMYIYPGVARSSRTGVRNRWHGVTRSFFTTNRTTWTK